MTASKSAVATATGLAATQTKNPSSWDPQDDVLLRHLKEVKKLGWKEIAQYFKNRTPNACQFRWRRLRSGNLKTVGKQSDVLEDLSSVSGSADTLASGSGSPANLGSQYTGSDCSNTNASGFATIGDNKVKNEGDLKGSYFSNGPQANAVSNPITNSAMSSSMTISSPVPIAAPYMDSSMAGTASRSNSAVPIAYHSSTMNSPQPTYGYSPHQHLVNQPHFQSRSQSQSAASSDKFIKPRSLSHTVAPASGFLQSASTSHLPSFEVNSNAEDENLGLIPKVVVRSRRASLAQQPLLAHSASAAPSLPSVSSTSNLSAALNTTLTTSKLRKNSFSSRTRRSSFNMAPPDRALSTTSRRSSIVQAPSSVTSITRRESFNTSSSRRSSAIHPRRESFVHGPNDRRESVSNYTDVPRSNLQHFAPSVGTALNQTVFPREVTGWSLEEDNLINKRQEKQLSLDELSILLPHRSEEEIQWRIGTLDRSTSSPSSNSPLDSPERSLTEDTAVEDESNEGVDDSSGQSSRRAFAIKKEVSPSLSLSSGSNDREHSPVFSPQTVNRDGSPSNFNTSSRPNLSKSLDASHYSCTPGLPGHLGHAYSSVNEPETANAHGAALPPLNSLFKNIL
ncbi:LADA_0D08592g1_1 [Lachancea dasiensis]|uniref:LADA_0D08592g1_1 n=1 Tax=Lachancea dasiensis TaxID=1072105 RepID=A0A1G4J6Z2_9SACH|nr:LADA_0D08592g1_1 [Lachancea dasiensis]